MTTINAATFGDTSSSSSVISSSGSSSSSSSPSPPPRVTTPPSYAKNFISYAQTLSPVQKEPFGRIKEVFNEFVADESARAVDYNRYIHLCGYYHQFTEAKKTFDQAVALGIADLATYNSYRFVSGSNERFFEEREVQLFHGSQAVEGKGVPIREVLNVMYFLKSRQEPRIEFNRSKATGFVKSGVSTAMALRFAKSFCSLREKYPKRYLHSSNTFLSRIHEIGRKFYCGSSLDCVNQAAFNAAEVSLSLFDEISVSLFEEASLIFDEEKNKVQSWAHLYGFTIDSASAPIQVDGLYCEQMLGRQIFELSDGVYLLRAVSPSKDKEQSMVYVKQDWEGFLYDPYIGAKYLCNVSHSQHVLERLKFHLEESQLNQVRFYRLSSLN